MTGPAVQVAVANPLDNHGWNEMLRSCDNRNVFHSANWARLITECYGYRPAYFTLSEQGEFRGCLPVMEVDSLLTGRRGVCLSFSDYCGALIRQPKDFLLVLESILELGRRHR